MEDLKCDKKAATVSISTIDTCDSAAERFPVPDGPLGIGWGLVRSSHASTEERNAPSLLDRSGFLCFDYNSM